MNNGDKKMRQQKLKQCQIECDSYFMKYASDGLIVTFAIDGIIPSFQQQ